MTVKRVGLLALLISAFLLGTMGQWVEAAPPAQEPTPTPDPALDAQADALAKEAVALFDQGDYPGALAKFEQALAVRQEMGDRAGEATALYNLGLTCYKLSDYAQARVYYEQALAIKQEIGDQAGEGKTLLNLGTVCYYLADDEQALDYYQQAADIKQELGDQASAADALINIGAVYHYHLADYEQAAVYYEQALATKQEIADREGEAGVQRRLGKVYATLADYDQALAHYQQALTIWQEVDNQAQTDSILEEMDNLCTDLSGYAQTLACYRAAQGVWLALDDQNRVTQTLEDVEITCRLLYDREKAVACLQQTLPIWREAGLQDKEAWALYQIGELYYDLDDFEQALAHYQQALEIVRATGDRESEAWALNNIGNAYKRLGENEQALAPYQQALAIFRDLGIGGGEASVLYNLGLVYTALDDDDQALAYHQQAAAVRQEMGDHEGAVDVLINAGDSYRLNRFDHRQALIYYELALSIRQESGERIDEADLLRFMGGLLLGLCDYEHALSYCQQSLSISQEIGRMALTVESLICIGRIYHILSDHEQALIYFQQAKAIRQEIIDQAGEGQLVYTGANEAKILRYIGLALSGLSDYEQALDYCRQALAIEQEMGDRGGESETLVAIGGIHWALSDYERALAYYQQALESSREIGHRSVEAATLNNIAMVYEIQSNHEQALVYFQQALAICQTIGYRFGEALALNNIGTVYELQGHDSQALEYHLQSIDVRESIRTEVKVEALQMALASQDVDAYQIAVRLLVGMGRSEEAFDLAERNRARAFLDTMANNRPDVRQSADAALLQQQETLHGELAALESGLLAEKSKSPDTQSEQVLEAIQNQLADKQKEYADLLTQIQLSNPELASLVTVASTTVADTQALLDAQTTLVAYYLTDENVLASVVTRDSFQMVELPASADEIARAVESFRSLGLANLTNPHPRSLTDLHAWLVAPLIDHLSTPRVGIIPHQVLHYVPFAALSDGERYFGQQFTLFQLPSASTLRFIQDKVGREATHPLILGDPQTDNASLPRLDHAVREAERVAELFDAQALVGSQASEAALWAQAGEAGVIHLAVHGSFNPAAPLFSRLWLAPGEGQDGRMNVHEVYGLDLAQADLVVLSACQTQLGELSAGDEVVGLNRAFLYGAPTVVASLWSVDDEATGALMGQFYTHLLAGMGKAEALQAAQNQVRTDPAHLEWAHPYYWAAFVLSGDAGPRSVGLVDKVESMPEPQATSTPAPAAKKTGSLYLFGASLLLVLVGLFALIRIRRSSRR